MPNPGRQWSPEERAVLRETCNLIYDALVVLTDSPEQVIPDDAFAPGDLNRIVAVTESRGVSLRALDRLGRDHPPPRVRPHRR